MYGIFNINNSIVIVIELSSILYAFVITLIIINILLVLLNILNLLEPR